MRAYKSAVFAFVAFTLGAWPVAQDVNLSNYRNRGARFSSTVRRSAPSDCDLAESREMDEESLLNNEGSRLSR